MPKSLFASRTCQAAAVALVGGLAPIALTCSYQHRLPKLEEAIATAALLTTFASTIVGRVQQSPVYTPDGLPGPSKSDFEFEKE